MQKMKTAAARKPSWLGPVLSVLCVAWASASLAQEKKPQAQFDLLMHSESFDGAQVRTTPSNRRLVPIEVSLPATVEIEDAAPEAVQRSVAATDKSPLTKGAKLLAANNDGTIFCGPLASRGLFKGGPCLVDADKDGQFEAALKGGSDAVEPAGLGVSKYSLLGIEFGKPIQLQTPIRYHKVATQHGNRAAGWLYLRSNFDAKRPGPVLIGFDFRAESEWQGSIIVTRTAIIEYSGKPVSVQFGGLEITVESVGPKGEITYRIKGQMKDVPMPFEFYERISPTIIFI